MSNISLFNADFVEKVIEVASLKKVENRTFGWKLMKHQCELCSHHDNFCDMKKKTLPQIFICGQEARQKASNLPCSFWISTNSRRKQ